MIHNDGSMRPPGAMSLTGDLASGWLRWIERFQLYMLATEKTTKPGPVQVAMLLTLMGPEVIDIFRTFEWENVVDKDDIFFFFFFSSSFPTFMWGRCVL